ncbi:hypothetical protein M3Y97_00960200 [Aphelenchoides bicaudatus]|nr:hypothetical protein M3Y97_00960200 [Aphelenchoides bicaudatus]
MGKVMRVSQFALGFCSSIVVITAFRFMIESLFSGKMSEIIIISNEPTTLPRIKDRPPEFLDDVPHPSPSSRSELTAKKRLREIEERQDKVQAAGERRLENLELFQQMNRDPLPTVSAFGTTDANKICKGDDASRCLPKFLNLESRMRTAAQYKLAVCVIQKSMSTLLAATMCYLHNETSFVSAGRSFRHEYSNDRLCLKENEFDSVKKAIGGNDTTDWTLLTAVREPIDRFLSGYVDKCISNNCWANMTCFILTEYQRLMNQTNAKKLPNTFEDRHALWSTELTVSGMNFWFKTLEHCRMGKYIEDFDLIRYSGANEVGVLSFKRQFFRVLRAAGVPENSMSFIRFQMEGDRSIHSTIGSKAREFFENRLRSSPFLMEYVIRMFYYDFELYGFEQPKIEFKV